MSDNLVCGFKDLDASQRWDITLQRIRFEGWRKHCVVRFYGVCGFFNMVMALTLLKQGSVVTVLLTEKQVSVKLKHALTF